MATFDIYQLKDIPENREIRFTNTAMLKELKIAKIEDIHVSRYDHMYSDEFKAGMSLDDIFRRFNIERPADFKGHSLSSATSSSSIRIRENRRPTMWTASISRS